MPDCDRCHKPLVDFQYRCIPCKTFRLCVKCYPKANTVHDPHHTFLGMEIKAKPSEAATPSGPPAAAPPPIVVATATNAGPSSSVAKPRPAVAIPLGHIVAPAEMPTGPPPVHRPIQPSSSQAGPSSNATSAFTAPIAPAAPVAAPPPIRPDPPPVSGGGGGGGGGEAAPIAPEQVPQCSQCARPLRHYLYRCTTCSDYRLCVKCHERAPYIHDRAHTFFGGAPDEPLPAAPASPKPEIKPTPSAPAPVTPTAAPPQTQPTQAVSPSGTASSPGRTGSGVGQRPLTPHSDSTAGAQVSGSESGSEDDSESQVEVKKKPTPAPAAAPPKPPVQNPPAESAAINDIRARVATLMGQVSLDSPEKESPKPQSLRDRVKADAAKRNPTAGPAPAKPAAAQPPPPATKPATKDESSSSSSSSESGDEAPAKPKPKPAATEKPPERRRVPSSKEKEKEKERQREKPAERSREETSPVTTPRRNYDEERPPLSARSTSQDYSERAPPSTRSGGSTNKPSAGRISSRAVIRKAAPINGQLIKEQYLYRSMAETMESELHRIQAEMDELQRERQAEKVQWMRIRSELYARLEQARHRTVEGTHAPVYYHATPSDHSYHRGAHASGEPHALHSGHSPTGDSGYDRTAYNFEPHGSNYWDDLRPAHHTAALGALPRNPRVPDPPVTTAGLFAPEVEDSEGMDAIRRRHRSSVGASNYSGRLDNDPIPAPRRDVPVPELAFPRAATDDRAYRTEGSAEIFAPAHQPHPRRARSSSASNRMTAVDRRLNDLGAKVSVVDLAEPDISLADVSPIRNDPDGGDRRRGRERERAHAPAVLRLFHTPDDVPAEPKASFRSRSNPVRHTPAAQAQPSPPREHYVHNASFSDEAPNADYPEPDWFPRARADSSSRTRTPPSAGFTNGTRRSGSASAGTLRGHHPAPRDYSLPPGGPYQHQPHAQAKRAPAGRPPFVPRGTVLDEPLGAFSRTR